MSISDAQFTFATVTGVQSATTDSADYYDCGLAASEIGSGEPLVMLFKVEVAAAGTATYILNISDDADGSSGSEAVIVSSASLAAADLVADAEFTLDLPIGEPQLRYISFSVTADGGTLTTPVQISARMVPKSMATNSLKYHASGYSFA